MSTINNRTKKEIVSALEKEIRKVMPGKSIYFSEILKNNGVSLTSMSVKDNISVTYVTPAFCLDKYINDCASGKSYEDAAIEIARDYDAAIKAAPGFSVDVRIFNDYGFAKSYLGVSLINYNMNKERLTQIPYVMFSDMALIFKICLSENASSVITNKLLASWGVSIDQLKEDAIRNAQIINPATVKPLLDVMLDIMEDDTEAGCSDDLDEMMETIREQKEQNGSCVQYVLYNASRQYGAACIVYPGLLENIADAFGCSFFALPSSIHEWVLMPDDGKADLDAEILSDMVTEINNTTVSDTEVLEYHAYYYDRDKKEFRIA